MVVYRRERERERAVVSAFKNLKIKEKERARDRRLRRARRHTHTERETEVSFRLVSEREENIRRQQQNDYLVEQFRPVRCETKRVDQFARELAPSIGRDVVLHVREVHVPVERGESTVSRCASGLSVVVAMRFVVAPELVVFLHFCTECVQNESQKCEDYASRCGLYLPISK